ncbi:hypothetical protein [Nocardia sp. CA-135398]|uniref:hypothetical protein n=1 Tax=Nocardia sp. CA-135398 TaxID=3239977 RepID=UPI003D95AB2C
MLLRINRSELPKYRPARPTTTSILHRGSGCRRACRSAIAGTGRCRRSIRNALAPRIAAGQNLEPVTGAYLRYLIAVDTETRTGIFFVPGEFTEVEYKACAFEALGANLGSTLHVHSDCQVFHAADVVWQQLAARDPHDPDAEPGASIQ